MEKKLLERFLKKNCIRQIKQLRNEKLIKRKSENYMSSGKVVITRLIDRQIKKILHQNELLLKPDSHVKHQKVKLGLSN